jgi:hypothetical protein
LRSGEDYIVRRFMISNYCSVDITKKNKTGGAVSTYEEQEMYIQSFGGENTASVV